MANENETENQEIDREIKESQEEESQESPIEKANKIIQRLEELNKEATKVTAKFEKLLAEEKLNGRGIAGTQQQKEPTLKDKAKEFFSGTAIDKIIEEYG